MSEQQPSSEVSEHTFVQAPVTPLDEDGVGIAMVGTALFAVASVVLIAMRSRWLDASTDWWLWVAVAGTVIGLIGIGYTRWRKRPRG